MNPNKTNTFYILLIYIFFLGSKINAQGILKGKVIDSDSKEGLIGADIRIFKNGIFVMGGATDLDGNYSLPLEQGEYDLEVLYTGFITQKYKGLLIEEKKTSELNPIMKSLSGIIDCPFINAQIIPLQKIDLEFLTKKISHNQTKKLSTRNINEISTLTPGVSFTQ